MSEESGGQEQDYRVWIGAQPFDPRDVAEHARQQAAAAKQRRAAVAVAAGLPAATEIAPEAAIVQFTQGLTAPDIARLRAQYGLKLDQYIPNFVFLERLTQQTVGRLRSDFLVRACIDLDPSLKLAPWIVGSEGQPPDEALGIHDFHAVLFDDADFRAVESALAAVGAHDIKVFNNREIGGYASVSFALDELAGLSQVADVEDIVWVEPVAPITSTSVAAAATIQSGSAANTSIWNHGLNGEGQVIHVIENGWPDIMHCFFADAAPNQPGANHRKVVGQHVTNHVFVPPGLDPAEQQSRRAHATFVCGIAAGDELNNSGHHPDRGGAWAAKLTCGNHADLFPIPADPAANPPQPARPRQTDTMTMLVAGQRDGAFIHSCSWASVVGFPGTYNDYARTVDLFSWFREEHVVVAAAANSVVDPGETIPPVNCSPGIAKNTICVGAAAASWGRHGSGVAGPTVDGRRKPDLMAVGGGIESSLPTTATTKCDTGLSPVAQTSWATPHAAAAAALVRQYFTEGWYPTGKKQKGNSFTPTGALLKAVLLNSTVDLQGVPGYPSDLEGWGLIQLDRTLYFEGGVRNLAVWDVRQAAGLVPLTDIRAHDLVVLDGAEQLKITLVWIDPGTAYFTIPIPVTEDLRLPWVVNDLDLKVTAPDGTTYVGNDFTSGVSTSNGRRDDSLNNVEMVVVDAPATGRWLIEVHGVVRDPAQRPGQGYALVATGALGSPWLHLLFL
ncbi:MAG: S8 family serine peptidase [Actinomycetota bacterium]|nr:S8 family serine peptidase [Actinomycetota bacterium]